MICVFFFIYHTSAPTTPQWYIFYLLKVHSTLIELSALSTHLNGLAHIIHRVILTQKSFDSNTAWMPRRLWWRNMRLSWKLFVHNGSNSAGNLSFDITNSLVLLATFRWLLCTCKTSQPLPVFLRMPRNGFSLVIRKIDGRQRCLLMNFHCTVILRSTLNYVDSSLHLKLHWTIFFF